MVESLAGPLAQIDTSSYPLLRAFCLRTIPSFQSLSTIPSTTGTTKTLRNIGAVQPYSFEADVDDFFLDNRKLVAGCRIFHSTNMVFFRQHFHICTRFTIM